MDENLIHFKVAKIKISSACRQSFIHSFIIFIVTATLPQCAVPIRISVCLWTAV